MRVRQLVVVTVFALAGVMAGAQSSPPSLQDQLSAQYKFAKMGADSKGPALIEAGTILTIQKGGVLGFANNNVAVMPAKYQNGTPNPPALAKSNTASKAGSKTLAGSSANAAA